MPDRSWAAASRGLRLGGGRLVWIMLGLSALALLVAVWAAFMAVGQVSHSNAQVQHTLRVAAAINSLAAYNEQIETARRGNLIAPNTSFVGILQETEDAFDAE